MTPPSLTSEVMHLYSNKGMKRSYDQRPNTYLIPFEFVDYRNETTMQPQPVTIHRLSQVDNAIIMQGTVRSSAGDQEVKNYKLQEKQLTVLLKLLQARMKR